MTDMLVVVVVRKMCTFFLSSLQIRFEYVGFAITHTRTQTHTQARNLYGHNFGGGGVVLFAGFRGDCDTRRRRSPTGAQRSWLDGLSGAA